MYFTNRLNLPESIVTAVQKISSQYDAGDSDLTISQLLKPTRQVILEKRHWDDICEDVSERLWAMYGSIIHAVIEQCTSARTHMTEKRLYALIDGVRISGQIDSFDIEGGILQDYKFTSVYKVRNRLCPEEWVTQLNCYAYLMELNNIHVNSLELVAMLRDFSKPESMRDADYPKLPVLKFQVERWPRKRVHDWILDRIRAYKAGLIDLPLCTAEEMWSRPESYAVIKEGRKKAIKLCSSSRQAIAICKELGSNYHITKRPGVRMRCQLYCNVSKHCIQFKKHKGDLND